LCFSRKRTPDFSLSCSLYTAYVGCNVDNDKSERPEGTNYLEHSQIN